MIRQTLFKETITKDIGTITMGFCSKVSKYKERWEFVAKKQGSGGGSVGWKFTKKKLYK